MNCKNSESSQSATFIDYFLQPLIKNIPSYIKDSFNFVAKIRNIPVTNTSILVTLDIVSLYTNIPLDGAFQALNIFFNRYPNTKRPDATILNLLNIILYNNDFTFNNKIYLQKRGVAMGQNFAPSLANIYLALWEENLLSQSIKTPTVWLRYIDDIFLIWDHPLPDLLKFIDFINSFNPNIKITFEYSFTCITFLDLCVIKNENILNYRVSFKETNSHSLLHTTSNHPKHIFKGIIYSQLRRWASLCNTQEYFNDTCSNIFPIWRKRGYTKTLLRQMKNKVLTNLNLNISWNHFSNHCNNCTLSHHYHACHSNIINNSNFAIICNFNCTIKNVIYLIFCNKCYKFYVGLTTNFHTRMNKHLNSINNYCAKPVHQHFNSNCKIHNLKFLIIDSADSIEKLKIKESNYIKKFNTKIPEGFNIIENYSHCPHLVLPFNSHSFKIASNIKNICSNYKLNVKVVFKQGKNLSQLLGK